MSGYTQMNENKMFKLNGKKWYENLTPEQLAANFKEEYQPSRLINNIFNWYEWYKGNMYIANGNEWKSKGREPTIEEKRHAILRSIELKNNLLDVEKYFNENKINMFNFNKLNNITIPKKLIETNNKKDIKNNVLSKTVKKICLQIIICSILINLQEIINKKQNKEKMI